MAVSKDKKVKQREHPKDRDIPDIYNPDGYIYEHPAWNFAACDNVMWSLSGDCTMNCVKRKNTGG